MIKPTVGRVVHYHPYITDTELAFTVGEPLAAIITKVWTDRMVSLAVFDANGNAFGRISVYLFQGDAANPNENAMPFAEWVPYQTGQAAKTEKLQAQLDAKS